MVENEMPISLELTLTPEEMTVVSINNGGNPAMMKMATVRVI